MKLLIVTGLMLALCAATAARTVHQTFVLASVQVVDSTSAYPTLRLAASGPIAYAVETDPDGGGPTPQLVVRLYGVSAGEPGLSGAIDPFTVSLAAVDDGIQMTIAARDLPPGAALHVRPGAQSNELEIVAVQQP